MIYLIDKGLRVKIAHYNLINQVKCPGMLNECLCLGCKVKGEVEDKDIVKGFQPQPLADDNVNQGTCFADDNVNDNVNVNVNDYVN